MSQRIKYLLKNIGIIGFSSFTSKILIFFLVPIYTSALSTREYGIYDLSYSVIRLLTPILCIEIGDSLVKFLLEKNECANKEKIISVGFQIEIIAIFIGSILLIMLALSGLLRNCAAYLSYIVIFYICYSSYQFSIKLCRGLELVLKIGIASIIGAVVTFSLTVLFLLVLDYGIEGFYISSIMGQLLPTIFLLFSVGKNNFCFRACDRELAKSMILFALPVVFSSLGWWINSFSDRYITSVLIGESENGLLSTAYKIPTILTLIFQIFNEAWIISAIKENENEGSELFFQKIYMVVALVYGVLTCILITFSPLAAKIMFRGDFYMAWIYVPILLLSGYINGIAGFIGPILSAKNNTKALAHSALIGGTINIILNVIFAELFGVFGVAIATTIASVIILMVRYRSLKYKIDDALMIKTLICWVSILSLTIFRIKISSFIINLLILLFDIALFLFLFKDIVNRDVLKIIKTKGDR